jgi:hypothetical protein
MSITGLRSTVYRRQRTEDRRLKTTDAGESRMAGERTF